MIYSLAIKMTFIVSEYLTNEHMVLSGKFTVKIKYILS